MNRETCYYFFKKLFLIAFVVLFASNAYSQVSLTAEVPKVVESGETFRLLFSVNAQPSAFNPPVFTDVEVLAGPTSSTMSSTQIVNNKRTESFQVSYTYILKAEKEGKITIPAASVMVDGKSYSSAPVVIEVVKVNESSSNERNPESGTTISNDDLFLRLTLSKSRVVIGEPIIATLKLYTKVPISGFEEVKFPSFNGFWSQEIDTPSNIEFVRENVGGTIYNAALLRRYLLLPQQSGRLVIDGAELVSQVRIRANSGPRSMFDDFFDSYQTIRKRVSAPSVSVVAEPLPAGAPNSFGGGVGNFSISSRVTKDSVNANEALSLIVEIKGSGNLNLIEAPKVYIPSGFEVYDTKVSDNTTRGASGQSGVKQYEFPMIARAPGEYKIAPIEYSYYDIASKRYVTLTTQEILINVTNVHGAGALELSDSRMGVNRQLVRSISDDIRYIVTKRPALRKGNLFLFGSATYFLLILFIVVASILLERLLSIRVERNRDVAGKRNRRANKVAKAKLKNAGSLLKNSDFNAFYEELHRALIGYISDKLNLSLSDLSKDKIREQLLEREVGQDKIEELLYLIDQCELARFAPNQRGEEMDENYNRALDLISSMEL